MRKQRRNVLAALALTAGSAAAAMIIRRQQERRRPHVGLYFADGSMVSLPESSPQARPLVELGRDAISVARSA